MALLRSSFLGLCVFGALLVTACGDDPAPQGDGDKSPSGSDGKKDAGKDAGKASDAGKKSDAGTTAAAAVECGDNTCAPSPLAGSIPMLGGAVTPCCFDEDEGICSVMTAVNPTCAAPAKLDERCPASTVFGNSVAGCCTADNHCGLDSTMLGMGCRDLADPQVRMFIQGLPNPQTCDGEEIPLPAAPDAGKPATTGDAGKTDAGSSSTDAGKTDAGKTDAGR